MTYPPYPTKEQIAGRLETLSGEMLYVAGLMDYYGGAAPWAQHGRELAGAAEIAKQWASEIRQETPT